MIETPANIVIIVTLLHLSTFLFLGRFPFVRCPSAGNDGWLLQLSGHLPLGSFSVISYYWIHRAFNWNWVHVHLLGILDLVVQFLPFFGGNCAIFNCWTHASAFTGSWEMEPPQTPAPYLTPADTKDPAFRAIFCLLFLGNWCCAIFSLFLLHYWLSCPCYSKWPFLRLYLVFNRPSNTTLSRCRICVLP